VIGAQHAQHGTLTYQDPLGIRWVACKVLFYTLDTPPQPNPTIPGSGQNMRFALTCATHSGIIATHLFFGPANAHHADSAGVSPVSLGTGDH
jgi:hypothetical protein